uniref:Uncharacterized protein n=1 Tax=Lepeophtheirus salmonis TaxID=72036 RepID=A0A0K2TRS5_LEPSM
MMYPSPNEGFFILD